MPDIPAFTDAELDAIEGWAKNDLRGGNIGAQATARRTSGWWRPCGGCSSKRPG